MPVFAEGDNFTIVLGRGGVVQLKVVRRPDQTLEQGADNASRMRAALDVLLDDPRHNATALVMDLTEAPLPGPKTREFLGAVIARWDAAGCRVAVVYAHPTMRMLFRRLVAERAAAGGHCFESVREAELWAAGVPLDAVTSSGAFHSVTREKKDDDSV